jgi:LmbE family N-acetylglucosaminyl deacetylase
MKILAIGAHADDVELGAAGTIAKHAKAGDQVTILLVTHSGYENFDGKIIRDRQVALKESKESAKIMGVAEVRCLNYETKKVTYNVELIEDLNKQIDEIKPDIIYTHWDGDINQDHSAIAQATFVAGRNVSRILMYRSNWYKSYKHFESSFYVDITDFIELKEAAINAHKSETSRRGKNWFEFFKSQCQINGQEVGVKYAETFQVIKWLA